MTSWRETDHCVLRNKHRTPGQKKKVWRSLADGLAEKADSDDFEILLWSCLTPRSKKEENIVFLLSSHPETRNQADIFCVQGLNNGVWSTNLFSFHVGEIFTFFFKKNWMRAGFEGFLHFTIVECYVLCSTPADTSLFPHFILLLFFYWGIIDI